MSPIRKSQISKEAAELALKMYAHVWIRHPESRLAGEALRAALIVWEEATENTRAAIAARPMDGYRDPLLDFADNGTPSDEQIEDDYVGKRG